jgi:hypothetical protein
MAKKIFRVIGIIILALVILAAAFLLFMTLAEYRPDSVELVLPEYKDTSRDAKHRGLPDPAFMEHRLCRSGQRVRLLHGRRRECPQRGQGHCAVLP